MEMRPADASVDGPTTLSNFSCAGPCYELIVRLYGA